MTATLPVIADRDRADFHLRSQIRENERRDRMTDDVCGLVVMAFVESRYQMTRRMARALTDNDMIEHLLADHVHPTYTELRNFLIGECDARYVIACAAAFRAIVHFNRMIRVPHSISAEASRAWHGRYYEPGERGWL